jgi:hypothetical protein
MTLDHDLTDESFAGVAGAADFMLDDTTITNLYRAASDITPEPDEQAWLVAHAVRARMAPSTLANLNPHATPTRLGIFDVADD